MKEISKEILSECQNGNVAAFARLVERYERPLFAYVYRLGCAAADLEPEDIVQEIFLKVYQNIQNFKQLPGACFSTWLFTIARNHCVDLIRKKKKDAHRKESENKMLTDLPDRKLADAQQTILQKENTERISIAVEKLLEPFRTALILRYYEDVDYAEIAHILHCSEGTAKSRVSRAKHMLIGLLKSAGRIS
jgi:RNA polymerase sigma-70 factor (ECF subfamily)